MNVKEMNVMTIAWKIARDGAKRYGGKASEYIAESLKFAWMFKKGEPIKKINSSIEVELKEGSRQHKTWAAEIVGTHPQFGYDRVFLDKMVKPGISAIYVKMKEGSIYEVTNLFNHRAFVTVRNNEIVELSKEEMIAKFA